MLGADEAESNAGDSEEGVPHEECYFRVMTSNPKRAPTPIPALRFAHG